MSFKLNHRKILNIKLNSQRYNSNSVGISDILLQSCLIENSRTVFLPSVSTAVVLLGLYSFFQFDNAGANKNKLFNV